jgi:hypothetical protein
VRSIALLTYCFLAVSGCATRRVELGESLELDVRTVPASVLAGEAIEATYSLRNVSGQTLNLCSANGVSMILKSGESEKKWPLVLHGFTTDTACSGPITLRPGETKLFTERGTVRSDWPAGVATVIGSMRLWCGKGFTCRDHVLEASVVVDVHPAPAFNSALQPTRTAEPVSWVLQ